MNIGRIHFQRVALFAVAVLPFLYVQAALYVNASTLSEILGDGLGLLAPDGDAEPGGKVLLHSVLVLTLLIRGHGERADSRSLRRVTQLRVFAQVADDSYLVK